VASFDLLYESDPTDTCPNCCLLRRSHDPEHFLLTRELRALARQQAQHRQDTPFEQDANPVLSFYRWMVREGDNVSRSGS